MTTNAGSENNSSIPGFAENRSSVAKEKTEKALAAFLRPEFINRVDEIITFRHLDKNDFEKIADLMLTQLSDAMKHKDIKLTYTHDVLSYIADNSYSEKFGARNMRRYIERNVEDKIAEKIISSYPEKICGIHLSIKDNDINLSSI
jgi:ATP-dependent Clp protease ATP-binding subunit ClpA